MERETYLHLFSYCDHVRDLWLGLEEYMNKEFSIEPVQINEPNVIWKHLIPEQPKHLKKFLCLVTLPLELTTNIKRICNIEICSYKE